MSPTRRQPRRSARPAPEHRPLTVAMVSLGCPKNLVDSEKMLGLLAEAGLIPTDDERRADVILINTCGFLEASKAESLEAIREAVALKKRRGSKVRRVVVAGCLATRMGREILDAVPEIDAVVGVHQRGEIVRAVAGPAGDGPRLFLDSNMASLRAGVEIDTARLRLTPPHYAYLRISEGCSRGCAFCTIPSIRGPMRSKPLADVEAEARELIADGALELNVIGQDTTAYGKDIGFRGGLAGLLRRLDRLDGACWIRLLYAYPSDFRDSAIRAMADCPHVLPYVDLPLQHINDRVLSRMRRRVTRRQIETLLAKLRKRVPGVSIRTTFISGFPGETEAEHRELLRFVEDFGFDMLGVFEYSQEPSTPAARLPDQLPPEVKRARREELMAAQQRIVLAANAAAVGTETMVLIDREADDGWLVGRTPGQAPEVDSVTLIDSLDEHSANLAPRPGQIVPVRIVDYDGYDLVAAPTGPAVAESHAGEGS